MKKAIICSVLAALSFVPVAILGVVNGPRPEPVWVSEAHAAPAAPKTEPTAAEITVEPVQITASRPKAPSSHKKAAPCRDGETREVGALLWGKEAGEGATGSRTVTLRCPKG